MTRRRARDLVLHGGMTAVMVAAMILHSAPAALAAAAVLLIAAMALAPRSREDRTLHGHLADLLAMAVALALSAMAPAASGHVHSAAPRLLLAGVVVLWCAVRVVLLLRSRPRGVPVAAVVTGVGLGVMAVM